MISIKSDFLVAAMRLSDQAARVGPAAKAGLNAAMKRELYPAAMKNLRRIYTAENPIPLRASGKAARVRTGLLLASEYMVPAYAIDDGYETYADNRAESRRGYLYAPARHQYGQNYSEIGGLRGFVPRARGGFFKVRKRFVPATATALIDPWHAIAVREAGPAVIARFESVLREEMAL